MEDQNVQAAYDSKRPGQTRRSTSTLNLPTMSALFLAGCYLLLITPLWAQDSQSPTRLPDGQVKILALHAHRYQDQQVDRIRCEVFGEIQNLSSRLLKSVTVTIEFLDEKGRLIATEEGMLAFRVIAPGNARGEMRPLRSQEIGHFNQDTTQCPEKWLEGRIRYKIKTIEWQ